MSRSRTEGATRPSPTASFKNIDAAPFSRAKYQKTPRLSLGSRPWVPVRSAVVNAAPRSQTLLLGIFGGLGFVLALVGVYGVMSYLVSLQTREIGIRMALGAAPTQILRLVIAHGMKLALSGVLLGVVSGLAVTRFMRSLLFGISSTDPLTFASTWKARQVPLSVPPSVMSNEWPIVRIEENSAVSRAHGFDSTFRPPCCAKVDTFARLLRPRAPSHPC